MFDTANSSGHQAAQQVIVVFAAAALLIGPLGSMIEPKVETVSLYLNLEKNGGLISGLSERNFRLYVDGESRTFRLEKPEVPASIALLVEYSNSSGYFAADLNAALQGFLKHAPEGHWYALATFSHDLEIHTDFTQQIGEMAAAYSQLGLPAWREIDTYDAVYEMLDKMGRLPGRRIMIVVGSGLDTFSHSSMDRVQKKAESENVTILRRV